MSTMVAAEGVVRIAQGLLVASGGTFPSPCGSCRQIIAEFATPETKIHLARKGEKGIGFDVRTLLPLSFTQQVLWEKGTVDEDDVASSSPRSANGEQNSLKTNKKLFKNASV